MKDILYAKIIFGIFIIILFISCDNIKEIFDDNNKKNIKLIWKNSKVNMVPGSALIRNNLMYFGSFNGSFYITNLNDGSIKLKFDTKHDVYDPPIVDNNRIFFSSCDLNIYAIDTLGNLLWKTKYMDRIKNSMVEDDTTLIVSIRSDGIRKINKSNGNTIWHLKQSENSFMTNQPVIFNDLIYVGMFDKSGDFKEELIAINKNTGEIKWQNNYSDYFCSEAVISNTGLIINIDKYYKGGYVKKLDLNTGKEIWSIQMNCDAHFKPYADSSNVIVNTLDDKIVCIDNLNGKIKWSLDLIDLNELAYNFTAYKGNIYFGTTKFKLYSVNILTGKINFVEALNYVVDETILANGNLYFPAGGTELWMLKE